jgi:hypothetical protein
LTIEGPTAESLPVAGLGTTVVKVRNDSRWPATDLVMHVEAADGRTADMRLAYLGPAPAEETFSFPDQLPLPIDDPGWRGRVDLTDRLVADYSDERGMLRWRMTRLVTLTLESGPEFSMRTGDVKVEVERLR